MDDHSTIPFQPGKRASRLAAVVAAVCLTTAGVSEVRQDTAAAGLAQLRALAGEWEGSFEWSGGRGGGAVRATYYATGNGSAIVENLIMGGVPTMTSVYHLDGNDLRMTHYCAAQNQPRMRASRIDLAKGILEFAFVDVTNLTSPDAGHVHGLELHLLSADHITLTFLFESGSKQSTERIDLKRASAKPMVVPQYDKDGSLLRPKDFYTWVFVGSSIGLSYANNSDNSGPGMFHNVYTQPESYGEFMKTGKFPEKTIFIIDMRDSQQNVSIAKHGYTEGEAMGMDVSVKDHEHFPDGWAYFNFADDNGKFAEKTRAFPKDACFSCHAEHGAADNVFTQYYPALRKP